GLPTRGRTALIGEPLAWNEHCPWRPHDDSRPAAVEGHLGRGLAAGGALSRSLCDQADDERIGRRLFPCVRHRSGRPPMRAFPLGTGEPQAERPILLALLTEEHETRAPCVTIEDPCRAVRWETQRPHKHVAEDTALHHRLLKPPRCVLAVRDRGGDDDECQGE